MMYLIVGRTASGKDYLAHLLEKQNLNGVLSRTTRPKRGDDDNSHIFVTPEQAKKDNNRVAFTSSNGYEYYALDTDVLDKQWYIIDPNGIEPLAKAMLDTEFHIIYVSANDEERKRRYIERAKCDDPESGFESRNASEDEQFTKFEEMLNNNEHTDSMPLPSNIREIRILPNDFKEKTMVDAADKFAADWRTHKSLSNIVLQCIEFGIFQTNDNNEIQVIDKNTNSPTYVRPEFVADILMKDSHSLSIVIQEFLSQTAIFLQ